MGLFGPVPLAQGGEAARGPCGTLAILFRSEDDGGDDAIEYVDVTGITPASEVVTTGSFDASLLFDDACTPIVVRGKSSTGYVSWERTGPGTWESVPLATDLEAELGRVLESMAHRWAGRSSDGTLHVLGKATVSSGSMLVHGHRSAAAGSDWSFDLRPAPEATEIQQLAVGPEGAIHAVFQTTEYPCDPCNLDLYYGRLDPGTDTWDTSTVQAGMWGPPHDEEAVDPSLAIDANGDAWIAAAFERRAVTGSVTSAELRLYGTNPDQWCSEVPMTTSDSYAGSDGGAFTGARPQLRIDGHGRKHIVFSDVSQWHDDQNWANAIVGQVRYAVRTSDEWSVETLLSQDGQTVSPQPLIGVSVTRLLPSEDGTSFRVVATKTSWDTDSIYNDADMPLALETVMLSGSISYP